MPFLFSKVCDLLSALEDLSSRDPPLSPARYRQRSGEIIKSWFKAHRISINDPDVDVVALLSALFPAKRVDRVYCIQPTRLSRLLRRWLLLGSSRWPQLDQWQQPCRGDLSDCVQRILQQAEFPLPHYKDRVMLEQVDHALATVAATCRFSAPKARARGTDNDAQFAQALEPIYQRLQSRDAKCFTKMILKDYSCINFPENLIFACIDPRLPIAMRMYNDFESAINELKKLPASQMADPQQGGFTRQCANDAHLLSPKVGIKIGPPRWLKAKGGVKHAVNLIDRRTMSVERKHDGEYCQIHIDLTKGENCIQIFSKSGKDSTEDRKGAHQAIRHGLRIGRDDCKFSTRCIVEGELLVWDDRTKDYAEFHKIRKHVSRSGSFLGTALDSQPHPWEHLMIMFYDVMLIDEDPVLHQSYKNRRRLLYQMVKHTRGRAEVPFHARVRFDKAEGAEHLRKSLALAFVRRWEGLVLKPFDEPYFDLSKPGHGRFPSNWIKLKKDCIKGLGDTADFAVIGGGYDVTKVSRSSLSNLRWTHFYIGCLRNKRGVLEFGEKPHFLVFDQVSDCIKKEDLKTLNEHGYLRAIEPEDQEASELFHLQYASGLPRASIVFRVPFVFDIAGSGFDKSPNRDIFTLRFPRVMKIHWDRDWKNATGLDELQAMAAEARSVPPEHAQMKEVDAWIGKLGKLDRKTTCQQDSWDHSDDEDDLIDINSEQAPVQTMQKARRGSRKAVAPPFVRMDTGEMRDPEQRLDSGEVVGCPASKNSSASNTSGGSLQTPPRSSPSTDSDQTATMRVAGLQDGGDVHDKGRKRSIDVIETQEAPREVKRVRSNMGKQITQSSKQFSHDPAKLRSDNPLREITNSAPTPGSASSLESIRQSKKAAGDFNLIRKIPVGSAAHIHHIQPKSRRMAFPGSPGRETTASESTDTPSTQQTVVHDTVPAQANSPAQPTSNSLPLPTPPSTADGLREPELPDLQETKIVLSPVFIQNFRLVEPLYSLSATLPFKPSSFRQALDNPNDDSILRDTPKPTKQIVLLIDPDNTTEIRGAMLKLARRVPTWHPIPLAVWSWKVMEVIANGLDENDEEATKALQLMYYAKMAFNAEWGNDGAVEIEWLNGSNSRLAIVD